MRPHRVVVFPPFPDDDLGFFHRVEDLSVQQFVPEPGIEALAETVFPRRARFDIGGLCPHSRDPTADGLSNELRAVIRADEGRQAPQDEQIPQGVLAP